MAQLKKSPSSISSIYSTLIVIYLQETRFRDNTRLKRTCVEKAYLSSISSKLRDVAFLIHTVELLLLFMVKAFLILLAGL